MNLVHQGKSWSICAVDNAQSGIGDIRGIMWHVIHRGIWYGPLDNETSVIFRSKRAQEQIEPDRLTGLAVMHAF